MTDERVTEVRTKGESAVDEAKRVLDAMDIPTNDIVEIDLTIVRDDGSGDDSNDGSSSSGSRHGHLTEADREYGMIEAGSKYEQVARIVSEVTSEDDPVTSARIAEEIDGSDRSDVSASLSTLYKKRIVDREKDGREYVYWLDGHGENVLDDLEHQRGDS